MSGLLVRRMRALAARITRLLLAVRFDQEAHPMQGMPGDPARSVCVVRGVQGARGGDRAGFGVWPAGGVSTGEFTESTQGTRGVSEADGADA